MKEQDQPLDLQNVPSFSLKEQKDAQFTLNNYHQQLNDLHNSNNEQHKKYFDFNHQKTKAQVTIQHEAFEKPLLVQNGGQQSGKHQKGSKSMTVQQKKRQYSSSQPRHQPSASIVNTQAQPLINLHIQNAKIANQVKAINFQPQKRRQNQEIVKQNQPNQIINQSMNHARSKSKQRQRSGLTKKSYQISGKETLNQSNNRIAPGNNQFVFSFDNKENYSSNQFSPNRFKNLSNVMKNKMLDTDSSISSPKIKPDKFIAQQLEKQYFMDKSSLLKHLSPDKNLSKSQKRAKEKKEQNIQIVSDRLKNEAIKNKSNLSTIVNKQTLNESIVANSNNNFTTEKFNQRIKKAQMSSGYFTNNKIILNGVDRLIKENLKKIKSKEEEQISKRQIEEFKSKIKKMELSQRNQQVRKINASKIIAQRQETQKQSQKQAKDSAQGYKKHRSKSCMNQTESLFGGINGPRSRERLPQNKVEIGQENQKVENKKKREKSFVLELRDLQKQIDGEIRREIKAGKIDIQPTSAANKKVNLSTINAHKDTSYPKVKKEHLNFSVIDPKLHHKHRENSKEHLLLGDMSHQNLKIKRKSKSKDGGVNKSISQNIKKFIEKKKNIHSQLKSLEQTIEQKKHFKMKENLKNLDNFVKQHMRQQSHNINTKKIQFNQSNILDEQNKSKILKKLKPQFFKGKMKKIKKKVFDFLNYEGDPIVQENGDISQDIDEEYQNLIGSFQKRASSIRKDRSSSKERSGKKKSSSKKKKIKKKPQTMLNISVGLKEELEMTANQKKHQLQQESLHDQLRNGIYLPTLAPEKGATLIPPQSEIATLNKDNYEKGYYQKNESTEKKRAKNNQDSAKASTKSPKLQQKVSSLMHRYGHILPQSQKNGPSADTKLLIKLHSAAITIQQNFRKHLESKGFYDDDDKSSNGDSQMYVNSEDDNHQYRFDQTSQKKEYDAVAKQLIAQTSPLRIKKKQPTNEQSVINQGNKFYSEDSNDMEKVIVCSVITSARAEGEESLQNTQKYVPLRQKNQNLKKTSQTPSSLQTAFNTAIKTQVPPLVQRIQAVQVQDVAQQQSSSQRKGMVPSLDFTRLGPQQKEQVGKQPKLPDEESKNGESSNTSRSIFERNSFQVLQQKLSHAEQFNLNNYPEMLKMREEAIKYRELEEQKLLKKMVKSNQMSPRTYDIKRKELETWVSKEKEEVKKTRRVFEEQWKKTALMIEQTQKNQDFMKRILSDDTSKAYGAHPNKTGESFPSEQTQQAMLSSHRQGSLNSKRDDTTHILERIQDYKYEDGANPPLKLKAQEIPQKSDRQMKDQERHRELELKKEIEKMKEQERLEKERQMEQRQREMKEEENRRKAEEQRLIEIQRKKEEEQRKKKEEEERRKKEEEQRQKFLQEQKKREEEEELKRRADIEKQRRLKEELEQQERERQAKEQEIERKRQEREAKEKKDKEKQQKKQEQEMKKLDFNQKLAAIEQKFEQKKRQQFIASKHEPEIISQQFEPVLQQENDSESDIFNEDYDFVKKRETELLQREIHHQRGKEILPSEEDKLDEGIVDSHMQSLEDLAKDDENGRGLSRTRSSQYLNDNRIDENEIDNSSSKPALVNEKSLKNLNDVSIDEDNVAQRLYERQAQNIQISQAIKQESFFSKDFDTKDAQDVIQGLRVQDQDKTGEETKETTFEVPQSTPTNELNRDQASQSKDKILFQDGAEESKEKSQIADEDKRNIRLSQEMRNQIPVESEQFYQPVMPVSPSSINGDLRIQTGAQSLESTLTEQNELNIALKEVNNTAAQSQDSNLLQKVDLITDEIFQQLLGELKQDLNLLLQNHPHNSESPINQLEESGKLLIFERRGIKTDLFAIERYVEEVLSEILKQKEDFMENIQRPLVKNPREVLNQLQNSEIGSYDHFEVSYPPVLSLDLYLKLEKRRKHLREQEQQQQSSEERNSFEQSKNLLAECEHIHNKVLFDCINDSLLQFKPYGKDGDPLPWSRQNRRLKPIEEFTVEEMFEIVKHDLFRWAIMQAGTLPRREFIFNGVFDDELFAEIREKKLATLLAREMIETEPKWLNYEFEEAQVKIDIGDMILEQLVTETINILKVNAER